MPADGLQMTPVFRLAFTRLRQSALVRNTLTVMSGSAFAQAIAFGLSPIISRLFSPADFGVFGSFYAVLSVITGCVTLDYSQALMLPKEKVDAFSLFIISCLSTLLVGLGALTACLVSSSFLLGLIKSHNSWLLGLLVFAVIVGGLNQTFQAWCVRIKAFKRTSASQAVRGVAAGGMQVGLGYFKAGAGGLIVSGVLADLLAGLSLLWKVVPDFRANWQAVRWKRVKKLTVEYRDFPMYSASQNVIYAISSGLPVLLLAHYYGLTVAGAYAFGGRILTKPVVLVTNSLRQVLFQKGSETGHQGGRLMPLYIKTTVGLFAIAVLPSLVILRWAPQAFSWIFGERWHTAGEFSRWLVVWMLFSFCSLPAVVFARLIRIQHTVFWFNLFMLAATAAALVFGGLYLTAAQTVFLFSLISALMGCTLIVIVGRAVQRHERRGILSDDFSIPNDVEQK